MFEHSGGSQAHRAAERVVQALREQVPMLRQGLEARLGVNVRGPHPMVSWMGEHATGAGGIVSRCEVGVGGRTEYDAMDCNSCY